MKKLLLISPYWKEQHRWMVSSFKLAELWQRLGYNVVVVCMASESGVEKVSDTLTLHRRKDIFLKDPFNFGIAFGFAGYVRKLIKKENPDLIICNKVLFWSSFALIPLRLTGHKVLLLTDALVGMTWWPRGFFSKIIMGIGAWTVGWLVLLCSRHIVFFHPQQEKLLKRLGISKKSQVIPTGIDSSLYNAEKTDQGASLTVTYVGRLESVKGVDDFVAAAVPLKEEYPNLKIQIVGWYKDKHPLVEKYRHDVVFTGEQKDVAPILTASDIFVLPSYSEGLSNALMEAMASGCACIASDVGGNRLLLENGRSGFLFPAGDREALKAHIRRLIDDPAKRRQMGQLARGRIEDMFDWRIIGKKYDILFQKLLTS